MKENELILGIDTSNYTTSFALVDARGKVVLNYKKLLPVADGQCGLRQSEAVFSHIKQIPLASAAVREYITKHEAKIVAVGYSKFPRDVVGSYMPCFLTGEAVAASISDALNAELFSFSHQAGHIRAAVYSAGCEHLLSADTQFAAMHISGGTTEVLLVSPAVDRLTIKLLGGSSDISAGQAIDRVGVMMGMSFPAGKYMEEAAKSFNGAIYRPKLSVNKYSFNLSGVENIAKKIFSKNADTSETAAFVLDFIARTLKQVRDNVLDEYHRIPMVFSGGVMSCAYIKECLRAPDIYFAAPEFSSDNAAGIALLAYDKFRA